MIGIQTVMDAYPSFETTDIALVLSELSNSDVFTKKRVFRLSWKRGSLTRS